MLTESLSEAAAATANAANAAKPIPAATAPVAKPPPTAAVLACAPVATPGSGPRAVCMFCSPGGDGGLADGGVGGPPGETEVEKPELTDVVVPAAVTVR